MTTLYIVLGTIGFLLLAFILAERFVNYIVYKQMLREIRKRKRIIKL